MHRTVQGKLDRLTRILRENLSGVRVIRAFARTQEERRRFSDSTEEHTAAAIRVGRLSALLNPVTQLIMNAAILAIVWFGGVRVEAGGMTTGEIIAFINYVNQILLALIVVANLVVTFTKAYASAGRVLEVLDTEPSVQDGKGSPGRIPPPRRWNSGRSVFPTAGRGRRSSATSPLRFPGAATVGIIGGTGAGKSTLMNLLMRFYDVTSGQVLVEGADVRDYPLEELRSRIGLVPQQVELFSGTIADNIRWGAAEADDEQVREAARDGPGGGIHPAKKDGYDTVVERGAPI